MQTKAVINRNQDRLAAPAVEQVVALPMSSASLTLEIGRRLLVSTRTCASCAAGTFQNQAAATVCQSCAAGRYSTANSGSCASCSAGTYSGIGASSCTGCSPGKAQPLAGQGACSTCESSKYQALSGQTSCLVCSPGLSVTRGGTACEGAQHA
jgi:hypothetical protein